jgi:hypothetical protein
VATILVARPTFTAVASLTARCPELAAHGCDPALLLVGDEPYPPADVERAVAVPLIGVLPHDPRFARMLTGEPGSARQLQRTLLWRTLADLASRLTGLVPAPSAERRTEPTSVVEVDA